MRRCRVSALLAALMLSTWYRCKAVGQFSKERPRPVISGQGGGEVGRDLNLARRVRDGQGHADRVAALQPGGLADGGADADHVPARHHADRVPVLITVEVDQHGRALAGGELLDRLVRHNDSGVVPVRGDGRLERHAR
jgi:hypothetical protein